MSTDNYNFIGKSVLVTGAAQGIGFAIAEGFARAGATVFVNDRLAEPVEAAVSNLSDSIKDASIHPLPFDVTDERAVMAALAGDAPRTWSGPRSFLPPTRAALLPARHSTSTAG